MPDKPRSRIKKGNKKAPAQSEITMVTRVLEKYLGDSSKRVFCMLPYRSPPPLCKKNKRKFLSHCVEISNQTNLSKNVKKKKSKSKPNDL